MVLKHQRYQPPFVNVANVRSLYNMFVIITIREHMLSFCQMRRASTAPTEPFLLHCMIGWKNSTNHSMQVNTPKNYNNKTNVQQL